MTAQHPGETYRATIETRRPAETGGGMCTLIVRRVAGRVQLLHHGVLSTGAELTDDEAHELAGYVTAPPERVRRDRLPLGSVRRPTRSPSAPRSWRPPARAELGARGVNLNDPAE
ncbi:MAG: hypothetical protein GEU83_01715 [Pseudonocardiaceae bacterium]|nr:hypothetical protein [Pseudonocardiaceae bacterium]